MNNQLEQLNWNVTKENLYAQDGTKLGVYGIFRDTDRAFLGAVKSRYVPYQNHQLMEAFNLAAEQVGVAFTKGGELLGGRKVYIQAELPERFIGHSGVKRLITAVNSHDGSSSIGFGSSNTVIVCQNTFFKALKDVHKVRHYSTAHEDVMRLAEELNEAILADETLMKRFQELSEVSLTDNMVDRLLKDLFGDMKQEKPRSVVNFNEALEIELGLAGRNAWGLFNGVTRYTNHYAPGTDDYIMAGSGYRMNNKALELITQYA